MFKLQISLEKMNINLFFFWEGEFLETVGQPDEQATVK